MSTLGKRTFLILMILSVSIGIAFAEGQADILNSREFLSEEAADSADGSILNDNFPGTGMRGRGSSRFAPMGERRGDELKYSDEPGVLVADVFVDSPADNAGILRGDVILSVEDIEVSNIRDIVLAIEGYEHGQTISLTLLRAEDEIVITLKLETRIGYPLIGIVGRPSGVMSDMGRFEMPFFGRGDEDSFGGRMMPGKRPGFMFESEDGDDTFGMLDIPEEILEAVTSGDAALIMSVVGGSPAEEAGIKEHMIVIALDGTNLEDGDLAGAVLEYEPGDTVEITLGDISGIIKVEVELGDNEGKPFLGVSYYPMESALQDFRLPFGMPGQKGFQEMPNFRLPDMDDN